MASLLLLESSLSCSRREAANFRTRNCWLPVETAVAVRRASLVRLTRLKESTPVMVALTLSWKPSYGMLPCKRFESRTEKQAATFVSCPRHHHLELSRSTFSIIQKHRLRLNCQRHPCPPSIATSRSIVCVRALFLSLFCHWEHSYASV